MGTFYTNIFNFTFTLNTFTFIGGGIFVLTTTFIFFEENIGFCFYYLLLSIPFYKNNIFTAFIIKITAFRTLYRWFNNSEEKVDIFSRLRYLHITKLIKNSRLLRFSNFFFWWSLNEWNIYVIIYIYKYICVSIYM